MATDESQLHIHSAYRLYERLQSTFPEYAADFEAKWSAWKQVISESSSSDPSTWSTLAPFANLVALGPKIIPALLDKLGLNHRDSAAIYLYNQLENDPQYKVDGDPEQQADAILEKNFHRNRAIRNALLDWAEYCDMISNHSSTRFWIECKEYEHLVELGVPVIPQLMVRYKNKEKFTLFTYELMHRILWGYQTGQMSIDMKMQYDMWVDWFERRNHEDAPRYDPVEREEH